MDILLEGARVLSPNPPYSFRRADVLLKGGKIGKVGPRLVSRGVDKIDCSRKILLPGLVNAHTHAAMSLLRGVGDDLQLAQWLETAILPREAKMSPSAVKAGALLACAEMIRGGTTAFNDMYFHMDSTAEAIEKSGMRAMLGYGMVDLGDFEGKGRKELAEAERFVRAPRSKGHGLITYALTPHAPYTCSKELLQETARLSKSRGIPIHIHVSETRQELSDILAKTKMRPIDYLNSLGCITSRTIAAHGVYASKSEVVTLAKAGTSLAHCPVSNLKLAGGGAAPVPEFLAAGANIALGTDGAASNNSLNLSESMKVGAIEQKNFRFDATAVKADDFLAMATVGGARALNIKGGKIAPGHVADLILLDSRAPNLVPFTNNAGWLVYAAGPQNVTDVMVDGKWLMREKELLTLDEERVLEAAQKEADRLL